jgi:GntR family transcriptional regulator
MHGSSRDLLSGLRRSTGPGGGGCPSRGYSRCSPRPTGELRGGALVPIDPSSDRAVFRQLADELRDEIRSGRRPGGSQLPTESEFQAQWGVSRTTVRAALRVLEAEGLVFSRKGYGSYVRERPPIRRIGSTQRHAAHRATGKPIFDTEIEAQDRIPSRRILEVGRGEPPSDIAAWLDVKPEETVVIRRRLQLVNDEPMVFSSSYYPMFVARDSRLEDPGPLPEGPDTLIERLGHRFARTVEVVSARMPSPEEARLLRLSPGTPVVRLLHVDYDDQGRPLQVADDLYVGDRHEFLYEWSEPADERRHGGVDPEPDP